MPKIFFWTEILWVYGSGPTHFSSLPVSSFLGLGSAAGGGVATVGGGWVTGSSSSVLWKQSVT